MNLEKNLMVIQIKSFTFEAERDIWI